MVIASIDLMDGIAVQLQQGKEKVFERENPVELAAEFDRYGEIAVIDLDGAMDKGDNLEIIKRILKKGECRVGGGIRDINKAKELISFGAKKIIIGTTAFENDRVNHEFLKEISDAVGKIRLIIAIDAINDEIVTQGWKHKTGLNLFEVVLQLNNYCSEYLFTCVEREGMLSGTNLEIVKKLKSLTHNKITVAGGVSSISEIKEIARLHFDVQLGMALYTGKINLIDAFVESLNWRRDLIPTITQNYSGEVLMQAFSSKESIRKSFETNKMWYFSRSRNRLWMKGESSGNIQTLIRLRADCDRDSILSTVKQVGAACHTLSFSCYGDRKYSLYELYEVIKNRLENPIPNSYTASLDDKLLAEKILEEAKEVIEAKEKENIIWEAADLLYFLSVLLAKNGIELDDVLFELNRRRKK
jgi:phosphoribosyl-ATP pyrophosphohydrolase/phosphoribosyl-AMP cyclohydrolase